jgi:hypothetical protein
MSSSLPTPRSTPSPEGVVREDKKPQNESVTAPVSSALISPPTTPSKSKTVPTVDTVTAVEPEPVDTVQVDTTELKRLLEFNGKTCGSPTKTTNAPCRRSINDSKITVIEVQIQSIATLVRAFQKPEEPLGDERTEQLEEEVKRRIRSSVEKLAELATCGDHTDNRTKIWKKALQVYSVEEQLQDTLDCFRYTSKYTCIGVKQDYNRTPCGFPISGKRVLKGKKTIALIVKPEHHSRDSDLSFLLQVLAWNMFCHHHTKQISERVEKWKSCIKIIFPVPSSSGTKFIENTSNDETQTPGITSKSHVSDNVSPVPDEKSLPGPELRKFEGNPAEYWDDAYDTSAFVTKTEDDRPSDYLGSYPLISQKIKEQLKQSETREGFVYAYEVDGNKGFVKIGYTADSVKVRMDGWMDQCARVPKVLYPPELAEKIPHANRVEGLCLAELKHRNKIVYCEACPKRHVEWVEVPIEEAIAVIKKWTTWIKTLPYEDSKKKLTSWDIRNGLSSWTIKRMEADRIVDMPTFMETIAEASKPENEKDDSDNQATAQIRQPSD